MTEARYTMKTFHSVGMLRAIVEFVTKSNGVTQQEIADEFAIGKPRVGEYLHCASVEFDLVHSLPRPKGQGNNGGLTPLVWVGGARPAGELTPTVKQMNRKPRPAKVIPTRDGLVSALFGGVSK